MPSRLIAYAVAGIALVGGLLSPEAARAQDQGGEDPNCLSADPPQISEPEQRIGFGITPLEAGSAGASQLEPEPVDLGAERRALGRLEPPRRTLVMRLNRMFMADGIEGIRRYARIVDRYARWGFNSELQVRYHPDEQDEGRMKPWKRYVRLATRILGKRRSVTALSITNEANFKGSPNTSDGSYEGVRRAVVRGTVAAQRTLARIGRRDIELGFSFAWRWTPESDRSFWEDLGRIGDREFRRAVDYVGLQVYPHLVWPPAPRPGVSAGEEVVEALTLLRRCYMPKAHLGKRVDVWISENGYATNLGRNRKSQRSSLASTMRWLERYSGELGLSEYRWFNLRDNNSDGPDLFDAVGVLTDDYRRKQAFGALRNAIERFGVRG